VQDRSRAGRGRSTQRTPGTDDSWRLEIAFEDHQRFEQFMDTMVHLTPTAERELSSILRPAMTAVLTKSMVQISGHLWAAFAPEQWKLQRRKYPQYGTHLPTPSDHCRQLTLLTECLVRRTCPMGTLRSGRDHYIRLFLLIYKPMARNRSLLGRRGTFQCTLTYMQPQS
jgi:hypothetical protein